MKGGLAGVFEKEELLLAFPSLNINKIFSHTNSYTLQQGVDLGGPQVGKQQSNHTTTRTTRQERSQTSKERPAKATVGRYVNLQGHYGVATEGSRAERGGNRDVEEEIEESKEGMRGEREVFLLAD